MNYKRIHAPTFARPADTTAYAAGDLVANSTTAGSVVPLVFNGGAFSESLIHRAVMWSSNNTVTNKNYRLWLFAEAPTVTNGDNGALAVTAANGQALVGILGSTAALASGNGSINVFEPTDSAATALRRWPFAGKQQMWGLLQANAAYTPTSAEEYRIWLEIQA